MRWVSTKISEPIYKGPSIKDVRRDGAGMVWSIADTCGQGEGVKDLADVRKLALF